jgi:methyl-accepting chemotaxis protein
LRLITPRCRKVVKFATDITHAKQRSAYYEGQVEALSRSQAIIEFELDGTIVSANKNFLDTLGYELSEIVGKHHSMFVLPAYAASQDYKDFWKALGNGEFKAAEFERVGKGGKQVWIQASYNPIVDASGKIYRVIKFATDTTAQVLARQNEAVFEEAAKNLTEIDEAISLARKQSMEATAASRETSANVQAVASGAEELNSSIQEIAESMSRSKVASDSAFSSGDSGR